MKLTIPTIQSKIGDKIFSTEWYIFFNNIWKRLLGKFDVYLGGILNNNITAVSSVGASSDLMSYSLNANSLVTEKDLLEIEVFGTFAANANNKSISLIFGSTTIFTISPTAINNGSWFLQARIVRASSSTQEIIVSGNGTNAVLQKTVYTSGAENLTTTLTIKVSCTGVANGDIVQKGLTIKLYSQ